MSNVDAAYTKIIALFVNSIKVELAAINLGNSQLSDSLVGKAVKEQDAIDIVMNFYGEFVISGRKPLTKKVPIDALLKWIKAKGITPKKDGMSETSLAFAMQNAIYKNGIKAKDFLSVPIEENLESAALMLADALWQDLIDGLDETFDG
jgi:hypothetical protein